MLRVVLDTNIYVSAFTQPKSKVAQIWRQAVDRRYRLLISRDIICEMAQVLRYKFDFLEARLLQSMKEAAHVAEIIRPMHSLSVVLSDPDDNRILECAVEGKADVIVSGDRDLLRLQSYQNMPIVRPMDFLRILGVTETN